MTLGRTRLGINKGRAPFRRPDKLAPLRGWLRQETLYDRCSVTFDLRQCGQD